MSVQSKSPPVLAPPPEVPVVDDALSPALLARLRQAVALHRSQQLAAARSHYEAVLAVHPDHRDTLHLLGSLLRQMKQSAQALTLIERAIDLGSPSGAELNNLGNVLFDLRDYEAALARFDQAIALAPDLPDAFNGRGNALRALKRIPEALASFDRALILRPDFAEVHNNRGNLLREARRYPEALVAYDRALALKPKLAEAYNNRAHAHQALKQYDAAARDYGQALACRPGYENALGLMLHASMLIADWTDWDHKVTSLAQALSRGERASPLLPVLSLFDSPPMHQKTARVWMQTQHPPNRALGPLAPRTPSPRLRVGYLSGDLGNHPVGHLVSGLIRAHDRKRFEVVALSAAERPNDPLQQQFIDTFDQWVDLSALTDIAAAQRIRNLKLDIVLDLGGYTQGSRTAVLAYRTAPLQVAYLGFPGTLGAPFIDYVLADRMVIPEAARVFYDEKVVWLPWFQPNDQHRLIAPNVYTRQASGLPEDAFVFCCFNTHYKISPSTFAGWMRILKAVPHSILWLREGGPLLANHLRQHAQAAGIAPKRIVFAEVLASNAEHLARQQVADLFLDTLPYNAHTTAADALWAGLPVLTCAGRSYAARVGASVLTAAGLPELITSSQADYEALAIALAHDPARMAALRTRCIQGRDQAALFDTARYTRYLEAALQAMHQRQVAGLPPEHLQVT